MKKIVLLSAELSLLVTLSNLCMDREVRGRLSSLLKLVSYRMSLPVANSFVALPEMHPLYRRADQHLGELFNSEVIQVPNDILGDPGIVSSHQVVYQAMQKHPDVLLEADSGIVLEKYVYKADNIMPLDVYISRKRVVNMREKIKNMFTWQSFVDTAHVVYKAQDRETHALVAIVLATSFVKNSDAELRRQTAATQVMMSHLTKEGYKQFFMQLARRPSYAGIPLILGKSLEDYWADCGFSYTSQTPPQCLSRYHWPQGKK